MIADIAPVLLTLAQSLTGLDAVWENQARPYIPSVDRSIVLMSFGAISMVGSDETRPAWDPLIDHGEWSDTTVGQRKIPWRVKVCSLEQGDNDTAWATLEKFRIRLGRRGAGVILDALNDVGCSLADVGPTQDLQVPIDDRWASVAALDVMLNAAFTDTDPDRYTYIAKVTGTGALGSKVRDYEANLP